MPPPLPSELQALQRVAVIMDTAVRIPGTNITLGLDPLLGMFPVVGDVLGAVVGAATLVSAVRHHVPARIVARMAFNLLVDMGAGSVPVVGDVLDAALKVQKRNVDLLLEHRDATRPPLPMGAVATGAAVTIGTVLVGFGALLAWSALQVAQWGLGLF